MGFLLLHSKHFEGLEALKATGNWKMGGKAHVPMLSSSTILKVPGS